MHVLMLMLIISDLSGFLAGRVGTCMKSSRPKLSIYSSGATEVAAQLSVALYYPWWPCPGWLLVLCCLFAPLPPKPGDGTSGSSGLVCDGECA